MNFSAQGHFSSYCLQLIYRTSEAVVPPQLSTSKIMGLYGITTVELLVNPNGLLEGRPSCDFCGELVTPRLLRPPFIGSCSVCRRTKAALIPSPAGLPLINTIIACMPCHVAVICFLVPR